MFFLPRVPAVGAAAYPSLQRSLLAMEPVSPAQRGAGWAVGMSGTWGPLVPGPSWLGSHARVWALSSENCPGNAFGGGESHGLRNMAKKKKKNMSPRLSCPILPFRLSTQIPKRPPAPRPTGGLTTETQTPAQTGHCLGEGSREGGNSISEQLLKRKRIPVPLPCLRNPHLSRCLSVLPSSR